MKLPEDFQFSQGRLQDFLECHRRFYLRYIRKLSWPAVQAEPVLENERYLINGTIFHNLVHQLFSGIKPARLENFIHDNELKSWWTSLLTCIPEITGQKSWLPDVFPDRQLFHPETTLSTIFCGSRLIAKYDLIVTSTEKILILDWKTSRKRLNRSFWSNRMQSKIYPYLMVRAGQNIMQDFEMIPEKIEMVYWFANFPEQLERFPYEKFLYDRDEKYLSDLILTIKHLEEDDFNMTPDVKSCGFCLYRSFCERGLSAESLMISPEYENDEGSTDKLDFDQIPEISY